MAKKKNDLTLEEKLKNALVPVEEQPYPIPDNWVWTRLGEVTTIVGGGTPSSSVVEYYRDGEIPWISPADLSGYMNKYISFGKKNITQLGLQKSSAKLVPKNTVLLSTRAPIGYVVIANNELCTTQGFKNLLPSQLFVPSFLYWYLKFSKERLERHASGTTFLELSASKLSIVEFPLPPFQEQERIVERIESLFSKLDEAKEKIQSSLESFENRKSAILYQAFSGELTKKWREENNVKFDDWEERELREGCHINPKKISTKELNNDMYITFIPMASVSDVFGEVSMPLIKKLGEYKKGYTNFEQGDVLFAKITPCMENGKIAVVGELENNIGFGSTEFYVFRCNENTYNRFIYHFLRWKKFRQEARTVMSGAVGQQRVPKSFLEEYKVCFPPLEEQKEIVRILDNLFEKEQDTQEFIDLIENIDLMKKSILARAFRGELGTNIPEEEGAMEMLKTILEV